MWAKVAPGARVLERTMQLDGAGDFEVFHLGGATIEARRGFRSSLEAMAPLFAGAAPGGGQAPYRGRGAVVAVDIPGSPGKRAVVRQYRHGGLSGAIFGPWFAGGSRASRELMASARAVAGGVPSVEPIAAVTRRTLCLFYRAWFVSEEVAGAVDLAALAAEAGKDGSRAADLRRASRSAGRAVRAMHDVGFFHADLNIKNLVVVPGKKDSPAFLLDWDLAWSAGAPLSRGRRMRNLMRMDRSARKFQARGIPVPVKERLRFLKHYFAAGGVEPPSRSELKSWARASVIHRLAWYLFP